MCITFSSTDYWEPLEVCGDVAVAAASNDNTLLLLLLLLPEGL
jgi:hypothetical protein